MTNIQLPLWWVSYFITVMLDVFMFSMLSMLIAALPCVEFLLLCWVLWRPGKYAGCYAQCQFSIVMLSVMASWRVCQLQLCSVFIFYYYAECHGVLASMLIAANPVSNFYCYAECHGVLASRPIAAMLSVKFLLLC
jgi:hypothetical protein